MTRDGPSSAIYVPTSLADFAALGIAAPSHIWPCQEASGDLADAVGSATLVAAGTPLYAQAVTSWSRTAVGFADGTAGQRFSCAAGTGPNPESLSAAWLFYFKVVTNAGGANRRLLSLVDGLVTTGVQLTVVNGGSTLRVHCVNEATATGAHAHNDGDVHPGLLVYDLTNSIVRLYTDEEQINGTFNAGAVDAGKGPGAIAGNAPGVRILWMAAAGGANAEAWTKATLQTLGWTLAY